MRAKKILALLLIIIILFTNYAFAVTATISYTNQRTGGQKISSIANVIGVNDVYQSSDYNAKSIEVEFNDIKIYNYGTTTEQERQGSVLEKSQDIPQEYQPNEYYLFADKSTTSSGNGGTIKYGIRLPEGDVKLNNVATFLYKGGMKYNGETYDVQIDIKEVNKTGDSPIVLSSRLGSKPQGVEGIDPSKYTIGTCPTLGAELAEDDERDFKMEVAADYSIVKDGNKVSISGVWGVADVDGNEGLVIHNYKANSNNTFITQETLNDSASDNNLMYKMVDNGSSTYVYAPTAAGTTLGNVFFLMSTDTVSFTKTWDEETFGALFRFQDDVVKRYKKITTKVTGGTITPSITDIEDGQSKRIEYNPNDASRQYLKSITVDGVSVSLTQYKEGYDFNNIDKDHVIEVVYANKYKVDFDTKEGIPADPTKVDPQYVLSGEKATRPNTEITKDGYDFGGWNLSDSPYDFNTPVTKDITLEAVWIPKEYHVTYILNLNDTANHSSQNEDQRTFTAQSQFLFRDAKCSCGRHQFLGWYKTPNCEDGTEITGISYGTKGDQTVYAKWSENEFAYEEQHFIEENGRYNMDSPSERVTGKGKLGESKTAEPLQRILNLGYEQDTSKLSEATGTIQETGKLILRVYYKPKEWTITYHGDEGFHDSTNPDKYKTGESKTIKNALDREGYNFLGYFEDEALTPSKRITTTEGKRGNLDVYAGWQKIEEPETSAYAIVKYFVKKNDKYEERTDLRARIYGKVNDYVDAKILTIPGYEVNDDADGYQARGKIEASEVTELRIYYDPIVYHITYKLNGRPEDILSNETAYPKTYTVDSNVTFTEPEWAGYTFKGWYEDNTSFQKRLRSTEGKAEDIYIYAKWESNDVNYKVEHYLENEDGEYKLGIAKEKIGKTGQEVTEEPLKIQGYQETTTENTVKKGIVKADGSLVLRLYYNRIKYTVSFDPQNGETIPDQKVPYLDTADEPDAPKKEGNEFEYWYYINEDNNQVRYDFNKPVTSDIKLIAKWTPIKDNTSAPKPIPQTGQNDFLVFSMIAIITLAGAFGIRYFRLNKMMK